MDKTCKDSICAEAFILASIAGIKPRNPTRNEIQFAWTQPCMFFTATIIKGTFGKENPDVETANITTCTTVTTSMHNTVLYAEPALPTPKPFHGCIRTHYAATGQSLRSTQLEERVKEQNRIFSDLTKNVHHGSKVRNVDNFNSLSFLFII